MKKLMFGLSLMVLMMGVHAQADLIGYWTFDETGGITAVDSSGNGNDGVWVADNGAGLTWQEGILGGCARLEGTSVSTDSGQRFDITALSGLTTATGLTICGWVKPEENTAGWDYYKGVFMTRSVADKNGAETGQNYGLAFEKNSNFDYRLSGDSMDSGTISTDQWYHIAYVYDGTNFTIYVDGQQVNTKDNLTGILPITDGGTWNFGQDPGNWRRYFRGSLDDFAMWNEPLTGDDISLIYERGILQKSVGGTQYTPEPKAFSVNEAAGSDAVSFNVMLGQEPASYPAALTINGEVSSDFTLSTTTLNFDATNWDIPQTVTISPVDNEINDGDRDYTLTFSPVDANTAPTLVELTIVNDDIPSVNPKGLAHGMSSHWSFDTFPGGSGSILVDDLGMVDGTGEGNPVNSANTGRAIKFGAGAMDCRGTGDKGKINLGAIPLLNDPEQSFTISLWFNPEKLNEYRGIFCRRAAASSTTGLQSDSGKLEARINGAQVDHDGYTEGQWGHAVMTYDAATDTMTSYWNLDSRTATWTGPAFEPEPYFIGWEGADDSRYLYGQLDEIVLWDRSMTLEEVTELYNNGDGLEMTGSYEKVVKQEDDTTPITFDITLEEAVSYTDLEPNLLPITVNIVCSDDYSADMEVSQTTLIFNSADEIKTVNITMIPNSVRDFDKVFNLGLVDDDPNFVPSTGLISVEILDNELPSIILSGADEGELVVGEGGVGIFEESASYTVAFSEAPEGGATVTYQVADVPDYLDVEPESLVFDASDYDTPQMITVTAIDNTNVEGSYDGTPPEAYYTRMLSPEIVSDDISFAMIPLSNIDVTIAENDCGTFGSSPLDVSGPAGVADCIINLYDFAKMAEVWMECYMPNIEGCVTP